MEKRRVVVTGMGVIAPNGVGLNSFWEATSNGVSGVKEITSFDPENHSVKWAGEIRDFDPTAYMDKREARRLDRVAQFAMVCADEAVEMAGLGLKHPGAADADRIGVMVGSGIGGILTLEENARVYQEKGPRRVSPFMIPMLISNLIPGNISIRHGFRGPNFCHVSACATGAHSIGEAFRCIQQGHADIVVTGGVEGAITPLTVAGFANMKALSTSNERGPAMSRPFDKERDGFVIAEGGACLVLETLESARRRGVEIHGEIVGYGATSDAHHITAPADGGEGIVRAMRLALGEAGLATGDVSYVNAHGTSTPFNDKHETMAMKTVFGELVAKLPISSTKSMTGHLLGGAGALEAVVSLKAIAEGLIPPTINYEVPDPDCDLDYVPNEARRAQVDVAMSNSMGFGGQNACLIVRRFED